MNETEKKIETKNGGRVASNAGLGFPRLIETAPKNKRIILYDVKGWIFGKWNPYKLQWETDYGDQIVASHWLPRPANPKA
jgi:hypothetical protein